MWENNDYGSAQWINNYSYMYKKQIYFSIIF